MCRFPDRGGGGPFLKRRVCGGRRTALAVAVSVGASVGLGLLLIGKWNALETGVTAVPVAIAAGAVSLQIIALLARSEAWHVCVRAGGGTVGRRTLYRASSTGFVGGLLHTHLRALFGHLQVGPLLLPATDLGVSFRAPAALRATTRSQPEYVGTGKNR